jgi:hypothetical protein
MLRENKGGELVSEKLAELSEQATIVEVPPPANPDSNTGG